MTKRSEKETYDIFKKSLMLQLSPKLEPWEVDARAHIKTYIVHVLRMNFHQEIEASFIKGVRYGMELTHDHR
jgi:hypothetical protein